MRHLRRDELNVAVRIREAQPADVARLREIAAASKAHWGYDLARVREWAQRADFGLSAPQACDVFVAAVGDDPVAFATLVRKSDETRWLGDLWVEPQWIGRGVGTLLFGHVATRARALGAARLEWEAEPHSVAFYERVGGRRTGRQSVSSWDRPLPVMELTL